MSHRKGHKKSSSVKKSEQTRKRANKNRGPGTSKVKVKRCRTCDRQFKKTKKRRQRAVRKSTRISDRKGRKEERRDKRVEKRGKITSSTITPTPSKYTKKSENPRFL